jgi:glycine cleavage system H protein
LDNFFYTEEHDWIRFSGTIAFTGIAQFKLTGILQIDDIARFDYKEGDILEAGTILLHLRYRDYIIPMHAPVTCTLLEINPIVSEGFWEYIVNDPEGDGWLFRVAPKHRENSNMLHPSFYKKRLPSASIIQS